MTINNTNNFLAPVDNTGSIGAGNIGDIHQQNTITVGDFNSLERQLKEYGVSDNDITELKQAVAEESLKPSTPENLGDNIGSWLGDRAKECYTGALKVAPKIIEKALFSYLGLSS
ncbi:hypothetical protein [Photorhabdus sp. RM323S]|uniref:hypothetical protein n=1 Tax=Photorhabdus sp. RM323S TaxID=3342828 RepID=UPI0036DB6973